MAAEHLSDEEYIQTQESLVTFASLVREMPLGEFVRRAEYAHTVGPILDPTLYRDAAGKLDDVIALAKSLMPFQREISKQLAKAG